MTVVVAASNKGPAAGTITKPPTTLGGHRRGHRRPRHRLGERRPAARLLRPRPTAHGLAKPDLVAPGAHVVSLRAPGSTIDTQFPNYVDGSYRQGSGTSMATGVVRRGRPDAPGQPGLLPRPGQACPGRHGQDAASADPLAVGAGVVDASAAALGPSGRGQPGPGPLQRPAAWPRHRPGPARRPPRHRPGPDPRGHPDRPAAALEPGRLHQRPLGPLELVPLHLGDPPLERVSWYGNDWSGRKWHGSSWYGQEDSESYGSPLAGSAWYGAWERARARSRGDRDREALEETPSSSPSCWPRRPWPPPGSPGACSPRRACWPGRPGRSWRLPGPPDRGRVPDPIPVPRPRGRRGPVRGHPSRRCSPSHRSRWSSWSASPRRFPRGFSAFTRSRPASTSPSGWLPPPPAAWS